MLGFDPPLRESRPRKLGVGALREVIPISALPAPLKRRQDGEPADCLRSLLGPLLADIDPAGFLAPTVVVTGDNDLPVAVAGAQRLGDGARRLEAVKATVAGYPVISCSVAAVA